MKTQQITTFRTIQWNSTFWTLLGGTDNQTAEVESSADKPILVTQLSTLLQRAGFRVKEKVDRLDVKTCNLSLSCSFESTDRGTLLVLKAHPNWYEPYWWTAIGLGSWLYIAVTSFYHSAGAETFPIGFIIFAVFCVSGVFKRPCCSRDLNRFNRELYKCLTECEQ